MTMTPSTPDTADRGRTRIASRALNRVVSAVAADALGVDASKVDVALTDHRGELVLSVATPVRVVSLRSIQRNPELVGRSGGTLLERSARAQEQIRGRVSDLTGYRIARVAVRLKAADIRPENRVS